MQQRQPGEPEDISTAAATPEMSFSSGAPSKEEKPNTKLPRKSKIHKEVIDFTAETLISRRVLYLTNFSNLI